MSLSGSQQSAVRQSASPRFQSPHARRAWFGCLCKSTKWPFVESFPGTPRDARPPPALLLSGSQSADPGGTRQSQLRLRSSDESGNDPNRRNTSVPVHEQDHRFGTVEFRLARSRANHRLSRSCAIQWNASIPIQRATRRDRTRGDNTGREGTRGDDTGRDGRDGRRREGHQRHALRAVAEGGRNTRGQHRRSAPRVRRPASRDPPPSPPRPSRPASSTRSLCGRIGQWPSRLLNSSQ